MGDVSREILPKHLVRSDFWFRDGNIVIIAGSAAFKVHRGQLERHSEFFSDLFSIPQPIKQDLIDGCSYVELPDCPSDVFYFLSALYDGLYESFFLHSNLIILISSHRYLQNPFASGFPALSAVLRLSTKYFVEHLRQHCLARLNADWPSTLCGWDLKERGATDEYGRYLPRLPPISVIELALDMNLPSILSAALYDLSRYGPSKIMLGTYSPPTAFELLLNQICGSPLPISKPARLSRDMLCRVLRGREASQRFIATFIARDLNRRPPAPGCLNRKDDDDNNNKIIDSISHPCRESFYFIMLNILRSVGGIAANGRDADPLFTLIQATEMLFRTDFSDGQRQCGLRLCQPCKADFAISAAKAREEVWSLLPKWFGLVETETKISFLDLD